MWPFDIFSGKKETSKGDRPEHYFIMKNKRVVKNLEDLVAYLPTLSKEQFQEHANENKNDFAQWIQDVFKDQVLADAVRKAKNMQTIRFVISNYLTLQQTEKFMEAVKGMKEKKADKENLLEKKPQEFFGYSGRDISEVITLFEIFDKQKFKNYVAYKNNRELVVGWLNNFLKNKIATIQTDRDTVIALLRDQVLRPIKEEYEEIKRKISELRKSGKDPLFVELTMMMILPKIQLFSVTLRPEDYMAVKNLLGKAHEEVKIVQGQEIREEVKKFPAESNAKAVEKKEDSATEKKEEIKVGEIKPKEKGKIKQKLAKVKQILKRGKR